MIAQIINIGDEILIGQIINTNGAFLSKSLNSIGITVSEIISISDKKEDIINCIERSRKKSDIIIITGGLGPTNDDVTALAPGIGVTFILLVIANFINLIPGSEITGVPASLTNATDLPFFNVSIIKNIFCWEECS